AMAEVDAKGIGTGAKQAAEHVRVAARRADGGENLDLAAARFELCRHPIGPYGRAVRQHKTTREMSMSDTLDELPDAVAAAAFRRLVRHLRHRHDAQNIELMGLAGFCRNCLADWIREGGYPGDKAAARALIH